MSDSKVYIDIDAAEYGYVSQKNDGEVDLTPIGRLPQLEEITDDLVSKRKTLILSDNQNGQKVIALLDRGALYSGRGLDELAAQGFDIRQGHGAAFIEALRLLIEEREAAGIKPTITYSDLGWYPRSTTTDAGQEVELVYRANELIGTDEKSRYDGAYDVTPTGDYSIWRQMIIEDILPHTGLMVVLIAALSSVPVGLLGLHKEILRMIWHLLQPSGRGKGCISTCAISTLGLASSSPRPRVNAIGQAVYSQSLMMQWSTTSNAALGRMLGNYGAVVVLNELGKCQEKDLTSTCYSLSEGSEKARMSSDLKVRANEGFCTVFLSNGEHSLLGRCRRKAAGLSLRVLETDVPLTVDADHANRITDVCNNHYGFAAPMMAQHILDMGGFEPLNKRYEFLCKDLRKRFPKTIQVERFIETFVAPCMLTAELASEALDIPFDSDRILQFFVEYETKHGEDRATEKKSYEELLQEFAINHDRFIYRDDTAPAKKILKKKVPNNMPSGKIWGRITKKNVTMDDGRVLIREYEVYPKFVEQIIKQYGHDSLKSCQDAWISMGVYSYDDDKHRSRKRQMTEGSTRKDRVFVFLEFDDPNGSSKPLDTPSAPEGGQGSDSVEDRIAFFLQDDDDFDDFSYLEEDDDVA